jgi:hypothetical protein
MKIFKKLFASFAKKDQTDQAERLARLERGYLILLKRVLEIDGVQMPASKVAKFSDTVLQTSKDELNKGFNEPKPTIH